MFQQLDYQECYRKAAHESVINAIVLSPDGRRLITGSGDSTVLMWSTQSGSTLCCIKAHSPVLSLAWLKNSNGFLFGCENGMLASVNISEVRILSLLLGTHADAMYSLLYKRPISKSMPLRSAAYLQRKTTPFQYRQPRMTLRFGRARQDARKAKVHSCTSNDHHSYSTIVESWELKVKLESPNMFSRHQNVEVTSVNWEDQDAATCLTRLLVSYRWHGILYAIKSLQKSHRVSHIILARCWDVTKMTVLWRLAMEEW